MQSRDVQLRAQLDSSQAKTNEQLALVQAKTAEILEILEILKRQLAEYTEIKQGELNARLADAMTDVEAKAQHLLQAGPQPRAKQRARWLCSPWSWSTARLQGEEHL